MNEHDDPAKSGQWRALEERGRAELLRLKKQAKYRSFKELGFILLVWLTGAGLYLAWFYLAV